MARASKCFRRRITLPVCDSFQGAVGRVSASDQLPSKMWHPCKVMIAMISYLFLGMTGWTRDE